MNNEDYSEIEAEWRRSQDIEKQLQEAFDEDCKNLSEAALQQLEAEYNQEIIAFQEMMERAKSTDQFTAQFIQEIFGRMRIERMKWLEKNIKKNKRRIQKYYNQKLGKTNELDGKIERAKSAPILTVIERELGVNGISKQKNKVVCPFHSEKTPSCYLYENSNRFYCFGCHEKGDVVTFIMKYKNFSFIEAVKYLDENY